MTDMETESFKSIGGSRNKHQISIR